METGLLIAYLALGVMAVVPIYFGSYASLKKLPRTKKQTAKPSDTDYETSEDEAETEHLSREDAYWFPVVGSGVLFSLYMAFRFLSKEWMNYLLAGYFGMVGIGALTTVSEGLIRGVTGWKERGYHLRLTKKAKELFKLRFTHLHIVCFVASVAATGAYLYTKNWILSNVFGLAFAVTAVQLISLDSFQTGMILLAGLFFYDIFWVFGTEVMVSVAKNFDAPIKVVFPRDLAAEKLQFTMLGLGDIVIPGVYVALCLRFDQWRRMKHEGAKMQSKTDFSSVYFNACFFAYALGLVTTVVVMHTFQAAQPALLYLSPACILAVLITGAVRGELSLVFAFRSDEDDKNKKEDKPASAIKKESVAESQEEDEAGESTSVKKTPRRKKRSKKGGAASGTED